jgi:hypothetical protein
MRFVKTFLREIHLGVSSIPIEMQTYEVRPRMDRPASLSSATCCHLGRLSYDTHAECNRLCNAQQPLTSNCDPRLR